MKSIVKSSVSSVRKVPVRRSVVALSKKGFSDRAGEKKPESFQQIYIEEMKKERAAQEASTSGVGAADPVSGSASNNGEVAFESAMKRAKRKPTTQVRVDSAVRDVALGNTPQPVQGQAETAYVQFLGILFFLILLEGLFLGASGFLSEELDLFAQNTIYKIFSPTVGIFLAGSTAYGIWKTANDKAAADK